MTPHTGTAGDDTLISGDNTDGYKYMYGGDGDDLLIVNYDVSDNDDTFTLSVNGGAGQNTLKISGVVDDISNITIIGDSRFNEAFIRLYDDDSNYLGQIIVSGHPDDDALSISTLVIGTNTYDLTVGSFGDEISSMLILGAGDGDDNISSNVSWGPYGPIEVYGFAGDDTVEGGGQSDTLYGGGGDDLLSGGGDQDLFEFAAGHGNDTVSDFDTSEDTIRVSGFSADDILENSEIATVGGETGLLITIDDETSVFLMGVSANDIAVAVDS